MRLSALTLMLLLACSGPKKINGKVTSVTAKSAAAEAPGPALPHAEGGPTGSDETVATENFALEAQVPTVIAAASLICARAVAKNVFSCELFNADKTPMVIDAKQTLSWYFMAKDGSRSPLNNVHRSSSEVSSSVYFITVERTDGSLLVEIKSGPGSLSAKADLSAISADGLLSAIPNSEEFVQTIYPLSHTNSASGQADSLYFHDASIDTSKPECLNHTRSVYNPSAPIKEVTQKFVLETDAIGYFGLFEVCDLDTYSVTAFVTFPDGKVRRTQLVPSGPEGQDMMMTDKQTLKAGEYTIIVTQAVNSDGSRDDFFFRGIALFTEEKGLLDFTLDALSWK